MLHGSVCLLQLGCNLSARRHFISHLNSESPDGLETCETGQLWHVGVLLTTENAGCLHLHVYGDPLRVQHYLGNVLQVSSSARSLWALWREFKEVSAI